MSNDLIPTEAHINAISFMAKQANSSKFYASLGGEAGIFCIMLLARELDVPLMQSISGGIWNIQGKVEMSARMMNMKIRQSGHKMKIESDSQKCTITGIRKDTGEELTVSFTMEDAARAGLNTRDVWKKNPDDMLFARCLSKMARRLFPDVIGNCYVEGEISQSLKEDFPVGKKSFKNDLPSIREEKIETTIECSTIELEDIRHNIEKILEPLEEKHETISSQEAKELLELMIEDPSRLEKMLGHYDIESLNLLPKKHFEAALRIASMKKKTA